MSLRGNETGAKSCAGITYFTSAMKASGKQPMCFGRRGKVMTDVPLGDVVERSAKKGLQEKANVEFTYACVGYSQTTPNMEKLGMLPLCDVGMRFTVLKAPKHKATGDEDDEQKDGGDRPQGDDASDARTTARRPPARPPLGVSAAAKEEEDNKKPSFMERYARGALNFWKKSLEDYPRKFVDFQKKCLETQLKFATSAAKQAAYCGKAALRFTRDVVAWWLPR
mmetsp:Transcript_17116/g.55599  ORF Transcript_17116/g.55599 Transcript_17116/m.55599 type:complete len:224 (+) Transcript_17116:110-781(+)